ncbi:unnamed protein product [Didymodactylos carnosus]|uniref:Uncharacterized protein n=1 Tax=Didymodactylos carnosus TaxID=1234261 RepID=A0A815VZD5_9BILA|nr:unnamed protein product [Didymodactylos carnosus]CAF1541953.1 unnamed protein product [Didymodactylos carnosus]CAF4240146.1 unnamed protein product [Didymodactylos carnosus]CAF4402411.1 unnamed protein product [Didymodactylos carnosus]
MVPPPQIDTVKHIKKMLPLLNRVLGPFTEQAIEEGSTFDKHQLQNAAKVRYSNGHPKANQFYEANKIDKLKCDGITSDHELHLDSKCFKYSHDAKNLGHRWAPMRHVTTKYNLEPRHAYK